MNSPSSSNGSSVADQDLCDLVESITHTPLVQPSIKDTIEYVLAEVSQLKRKQAMIQEQMESKAKEVQGLRETLLVVGGALQGMQHIHQFITREQAAETACATAGRPSTAAGSGAQVAGAVGGTGPSSAPACATTPTPASGGPALAPTPI